MFDATRLDELYQGAVLSATNWLKIIEPGQPFPSSDTEAITAMANAPVIVYENQALVQNFIDTNPCGQALWKFSQEVAAKSTESASFIFTVLYGINTAFAKKALATGLGTPMRDYIEHIYTDFTKLSLPWSIDPFGEQAESDAQSFPWINANL